MRHPWYLSQMIQLFGYYIVIFDQYLSITWYIYAYVREQFPTNTHMRVWFPHCAHTYKIMLEHNIHIRFFRSLPFSPLSFFSIETCIDISNSLTSVQPVPSACSVNCEDTLSLYAYSDTESLVCGKHHLLANFPVCECECILELNVSHQLFECARPPYIQHSVVEIVIR